MNREYVKGTPFYNFSGKNLSEVAGRYAKLKADKVVLLPDFNPGKSPLPTGSHVELDIKRQRDWRRYTISDVGCGMRVVKSRLKWEDFDRERRLWTEMYHRLKANKNSASGLGDLGGGNHFLDAVVDGQENVYFVIHTGSRNESPVAERNLENPRKYDSIYKGIVRWAHDNREQIHCDLESVYGSAELVLDKPHNFYKREGDKVLIFKGSVELRPGETTVIPSHMAGEMALVTGKPALSDINYAVSHGTGRIRKRSESKKYSENFDYEGLRRLIFIPSEIKDASIRTDTPPCYRNLDDCLALLQDLVEITQRLYPIAYIGQI